MPIDITAYPHLIDCIIGNICSVKALLAWRSTSRQCRDLADARLFHHAVVRRTVLAPPKRSITSLAKRLVSRQQRKSDSPVGFLGRGVIDTSEGNAGGYDPTDERYVFGQVAIEFTTPARSGIKADVPLPHLPWKVGILDIEGAGRVVDTVFASVSAPRTEFIKSNWYQLKDTKARPIDHPLPTAPRSTPLILRRFGIAPIELWTGDVGTTVDFFTVGQWHQAVNVPATTSYVRHIEWRAAPPRDLPYETLKYKVDSATLVLAPHSKCPPSDLLVKELSNFVGDFIASASTVTFVGIENWLPGADYEQLKEEVMARIWERDGVVAYRGYTDGRVSSTPEELADKVRMVSVEEWWAELGELKEVVGVWSKEHRRV
ncbi:uncharacterized protein LOC62_04G005270 [Vanrija pseudolonga]|uniref:Uncharacterized protein n=1 Tax=Vanrija pseudolonga TaxID=143232 RepID=A0AAF1BM76_9TREE|nr:hypothetical protein LOC62_04G005270 [Vanrija pseudolonga]